MLRGASVRWDPLEWTHNEKRGGIDFKRQELLEWSVVTIPSDVGALEGAPSLAPASARAG